MKRYCGMCDAWVTGRECPKCGADTDVANHRTQERPTPVRDKHGAPEPVRWEHWPETEGL
jgi:hypothetical protein